MKLFFGLIVCILTITRWVYGDNVPGFKAGQEYEYGYSSSILTGVANQVNQYAGIKTKGTVIVQRQDDDYLYFKLKDFSQKGVNEKTKLAAILSNDTDYFGIVPDEGFKAPFRAKIKNGLVVAFDTVSQNDGWQFQSMKQAILSLLQLNITSDEKLYRNYENGVGGDCMVQYNIQSNGYLGRPDGKVLNVTKQRFDEMCKNRITPFFSFHRAHNCKICEFPLDVVSTTEYSLDGNSSSYTIEKVVNNGKYIFTPFGTNSEIITSVIEQNLNLVSISSINNKMEISDVAKYSTFTSLSSNIIANDKKTKVDLRVPNYYNRLYSSRNNTDYKEKIYSYLQELSRDHNDTEDLLERNDPYKLRELIISIGMLNFDQLMSFYKSHMDYSYYDASPNLQKQKEIFYQSLTLCGTNPVVAFILYHLENEHLPHQLGGKYFQLLPFYLKDHSESLVKHIHEFVKKIDKDEKNTLYIAFWQLFGTVVHDGCHKSSSDVDEGVNYVSLATCNKYATEARTRFHQATEVWEQLLFMKVISNMGLDGSFEQLKQIISSRYSTTVRVQALFNLILYSKDKETFGQEVLDLVLPIFYNHSEPVIITIAAFENIINSNPSYDIVQGIGEYLSKAPSRQVASYVYSTFKAFANTTNPCHRHFSDQAKLVLRTIPEYFYGYHYSQKLSFSYFNDKYNFGGETVVSFVGSNETLIPEYVYIQNSAFMLSRNYESSILIQAVGFSDVLRMLYSTDNPNESFKKLRNIYNHYGTELDALKEVLNILDRTTQTAEASMSTTLFGKNLFFFHTSPTEYINRLLMGDKLLPFLPGAKFNFEPNSCLPLMYADNTYEVPTDIGYPLSLSLQAPAYISTKGRYSFEYKKETTFSVHLTPVFHMQGVGHMALKSPSFTYAGYGVLHDVALKLPINVSLSLIAGENQFKFHYVPPATKTNVLSVRTAPFTFIGTDNGHTSVAVESNRTHLIHYRKVPFESTDKIGQKYFGFGLSLRKKHEYTWNGIGHAYKFFNSFFKTKSRTFDSYDYSYSVTQRIVSALNHVQHYFLIIPEPKPLELVLSYEPDKEHPTTEFNWNVSAEINDDMKASMPFPIDKTANVEITVLLNYSHCVNYGIKVDLEAKGKTDTRHYHLDMLASYNKRDNMPRKAIINYERSPIPGYDSDPFKFCYHEVLHLPQYQEMYSFDEHTAKKANDTIRIRFGKDCESHHKIDITMTIEKTDEEKVYDVDPGLYSEYKAFKNYINQGYNISIEECWKLFVEYYTLRKYTADIHYENLPDYFLTKVDKVTSAMEHYLLTNVEHIDTNVKNLNNHLKIVSNYSMFEPKLDIQVYAPERNLFYTEIYYPNLMPSVKHFNLRLDQMTHMWNQLFNWELDRFCSFQKDRVTTFDYVPYTFNVTNDVYYVLAKDCTNRDRFTVLFRQIDHKLNKMALKVYLLNHKIEILPVMDRSSNFTVQVDGVIQKNWHPSGTVYLYYDVHIPNNFAFTITHNRISYEIKSPIVNLNIMFNGDYVVVQTTNEYRSRACGLCGDMNSESTDEFVGPTKCSFVDSQKFANSYLIPNNLTDKLFEDDVSTMCFF